MGTLPNAASTWNRGDGLRRSIGGLLVAIPNGETRVVMLDSSGLKSCRGRMQANLCCTCATRQTKAKLFAGTAANVKFAQIHL